MTSRGALVASVSALAGLLLSLPASAVNLPPGFVVENAASGAGFNQPTALAFTPDGRILVAEKRGVLRVVQNGVKLVEPMWNGEWEVLGNGDRGLIGIAVDPHYDVNHHVYLLYTVDPDSDNVDINDDAFGRLTRYTTSATNPNAVDPLSRKVLIGGAWSDGFASGSPSHTVGDLQWGVDGSLLISCGEGAQYARADSGGRDAPLFGLDRTDPSEDIGAFRAQYLGSITGKLLRVNPANGNGYSNNPFFDGDLRSNQSRVWAYGLRNPFRLSLRPNTGCADTSAGNPAVVYIHDCGWRDFEEVDVSLGGENFGWPCYEGPLPQPEYMYRYPAHHGCSTVGTPDNPSAFTLPAITWHQTDTTLSIPVGLSGNCVGGGTFYRGHTYPPQYRNRLFFADFGRSWIKAASFDGNHRLMGVTHFGDAAEGPVFFTTDPVSGDILYVALTTGRLHRIRYTGPTAGNAAPIAVAACDQPIGTVPLTVSFSSSGSYNPDLEPFTAHWSFGDLTDSNLPSPQHTYTHTGVYEAVLTVDDGHGGVGLDTVVVVVEAVNTPPAASMLSPPGGAFYACGDTLRLEAAATDAQQDADQLQYHWQIDFEHDGQRHPAVQAADGRTATFVVPGTQEEPGGCYDVSLLVTDAGGLCDTVLTRIHPEVDLEPSPFATRPTRPAAFATAEYRFRIRNHGRMPAARSHWRLTANGATLAEGDTLAPARDSVSVVVTAPPVLGAATYAFRLELDALGTVRETDEGNNAWTLTRTLVEPPLSTLEVPPVLALSGACPNPSATGAGLRLDLPRGSNVEFGVYDLQGRTVWRAPARYCAAGRWSLVWPGMAPEGGAARPGIYLARVTADGRSFTRRIAVLH